MTLTQRVEAIERQIAELTGTIPAPAVNAPILKRHRFEFMLSDTNDGYEIVEWDDAHKFCWVVAFFDKASEGYDMRTVGSRFTDADYDAFELAQMAFDWLAEHEEGDDVDYT
jgi:hypothetical protein